MAQNASHPHSGRRVTSRLRVRLAMRLVTTSGTGPAVLADLSYFGARILMPNPPPPGTEVVLEWGHFEAFGIVVWSGQSTCGLNFFDPIDGPTLIATRELDDAEHLPNAVEQVRQQARRQARAWVAGR